MTSEEAIRAIKHNCPKYGYERLREALSMSIKALTKQAPMLAEDREHCPACLSHLGCEGFEQNYCDECGQKLIWAKKQGDRT